jgi:hypothetical protein
MVVHKNGGPKIEESEREQPCHVGGLLLQDIIGIQSALLQRSPTTCWTLEMESNLRRERARCYVVGPAER